MSKCDYEKKRAAFDRLLYLGYRPSYRIVPGTREIVFDAIVKYRGRIAALERRLKRHTEECPNSYATRILRAELAEERKGDDDIKIWRGQLLARVKLYEGLLYQMAAHPYRLRFYKGYQPGKLLGEQPPGVLLQVEEERERLRAL